MFQEAQVVKLQEFQVNLPPGGALLLYTDGIPEAHNPQDEQFSDERLQELFSENIHLGDVVSGWMVAAFTGGITGAMFVLGETADLGSATRRQI